jgi:hypothetical protein
VTAILAALLAVPLTAAQSNDAQTFTHLNIHGRGRVVSVDGGERESVAFYVKPLVLGKTVRWTLSVRAETCNFLVRPGGTLDSESIGGWRIAITPTAVDGDLVTFQMAWSRDDTHVNSKGARELGTYERETWQLKLRPGEFLTVDHLPLTRMAAGSPPPACAQAVKAVAFSIAVDREPPRDRDLRLLVTDLWLVERLPDGKERSQQVALRGRYYDPQPFYFDALSDRGMRLDIYGDLVAIPKTGYIEIQLATNRRFSSDDGTLQSSSVGTMRSLARVSADDVAAIELPPLGGTANGAFKDRVYSLRVRARQIRNASAAKFP